MGFAQWPDALPRMANRKLTRLDSVSPWYETFEVCKDTYAFLESCHEEEVISYLVIGTEKAALIDTGMGIVDLKPEIDRFCELPIVVVNTHSHVDHMGSNHQFMDIGAFDHPFEIDRIESGYTHQECMAFMLPGSYINLPRSFNLEKYRIKPSPLTRKLQHLDTISLGKRSLTVYHTPGHSPGSICLLEEPNKLLFTGDTVYPGTLIMNLLESDLQSYLNSLKQLAELRDTVNQLCPAHNEAIAHAALLVSVLHAVELAASGKINFEQRKKSRIFKFEGFNLILS